MGYRRIKNLVSIVIPAYNRENYIIESLESIVHQTYRDIEIIVIDDGSTDNTSKVVYEYIKKITAIDSSFQERVTLLTLPRNVGYAGALTIGMFMTKGEFIALQDSDDISHLERIERQVQHLRNNPKIDLVGTLYQGFKDGHFDTKEKPSSWIRFGEEIKKSYKKNGHCICHGTVLLRGHVFDKLGGYTRKYSKAIDVEWLSKCVLNGVRSDNIPEVLYYYRRHSQQMSKK